jgi:two-component system NarL family response regulator
MEAANAVRPKPVIAVLCVDDHPLVLEGIARKIGRQHDMKVIGTAATGEQAVEMYLKHRPDVVLMDLQLRGMSGLKAIEAIRRHDAAARVVVLTMYSGDEDIFRAIQAGASSYVLKESLAGELVAIVRQVYGGERPIPALVASRLATRHLSSALSGREVEVLELVSKGMRNKEISAALGVSQETVQTYLKRLFLKLGVNDRTAAVTVALTRGIVHLQ